MNGEKKIILEFNEEEAGCLVDLLDLGSDQLDWEMQRPFRLLPNEKNFAKKLRNNFITLRSKIQSVVKAANIEVKL